MFNVQHSTFGYASQRPTFPPTHTPYVWLLNEFWRHSTFHRSFSTTTLSPNFLRKDDPMNSEDIQFSSIIYVELLTRYLKFKDLIFAMDSKSNQSAGPRAKGCRSSHLNFFASLFNTFPKIAELSAPYPWHAGCFGTRESANYTRGWHFHVPLRLTPNCWRVYSRHSFHIYPP
jgi:hypothetical protein